MRKLSSVADLEGVLQFLERWGPIVIGTGLAAGASAWATSVSQAFAAYSPASWVFGGLLGALFFVGAASGWVWMRSKSDLRRYSAKLSEQANQINSLETVFTGKRIDLNSFKGLFNETVHKKTFVNCELRGPAAIYPIGGVFSMSGVGVLNCDFIRVSGNSVVFNAIPMEDLTIKDGSIIGLTIYIHESMVPVIDKGVKGVNWVTH